MAFVFAISQCTIIWRLRMWSSSIVVPSRMRRSCTSGGARVVLVLGPHDVIVVLGADQPHLDELRVGKKIQRHEIGARFLDGGVLLLQHRLRRASEAVRASSPTHGRSPRADRSRARARSPATSRARATSSGDHENSLRNPASIERSYASFTLEIDTDLLPYCSRTSCSFGRLMPIGVTGPASPVSMTTSMTFAVIPCTFSLQYCGSHGMRSSNHCASAGELLDGGGLGRVHVIDERFPRAFHAAGVEIDLGEPVDRIDRRRSCRRPRRCRTRGDRALRRCGTTE